MFSLIIKSEIDEENGDEMKEASTLEESNEATDALKKKKAARLNEVSGENWENELEGRLQK